MHDILVNVDPIYMLALAIASKVAEVSFPTSMDKAQHTQVRNQNYKSLQRSQVDEDSIISLPIARHPTCADSPCLRRYKPQGLRRRRHNVDSWRLETGTGKVAMVVLYIQQLH
eukprot:1139788-Pelagomonas_calceolata.AAC.2